MRRLIVTLMALAIAGLGAAVFAQQTPSWLTTPLKKPLNQVLIGITQSNVGTDSYETTYQKAFEAYAKQLGVKTIVLDAHGDPAQQVNQIQDLMTRHVDVMIVWPTNAKAACPPVIKAHNAGIPVVITNSKIDSSCVKDTVSFSGPDTLKEGEVAGQIMLQGLPNGGNIVIIDGKPGYTTAIRRHNGFMDVVKGHSDIHVLDSQPADWNRAKAQSVMEDFITKYGNKIDGVYAADDNMGAGALNAIQAAKNAGRLDANKTIILVGATNFAVGYDAMKKGLYYGSVVQSPVTDARNALKVAVQVAEGMSVPQNDYIDTPPITQANMSKYSRPVF
ncbi:MAG: sugar ABC transporter substrate-binding protein [Deinococcales bacterium]